MPLEPIEEKDMDLKAKFIAEPVVEKLVEAPIETQLIASVPEEKIERKEGAMEKDDAYAKILSKAQQTTPVAPIKAEDIKIDAEVASQEQGVEAKVSNLVNIAMQKGVVHAVKVAKHMNDNYMLDAFHDKMMMDDLHDALLAKGLIKNL
ncbi:MAG: hypothetical protein Q7T51_04855 [Candidatus Moranbacteria bacterium]|nr:hypothetical protein [Candidatus Moranbacteria bacterium]